MSTLNVSFPRKSALEGFSDAQVSMIHPRDLTLSPPAGAPPSYTDVLKQELQTIFTGLISQNIVYIFFFL